MTTTIIKLETERIKHQSRESKIYEIIGKYSTMLSEEVRNSLYEDAREEKVMMNGIIKQMKKELSNGEEDEK